MLLKSFRILRLHSYSHKSILHFCTSKPEVPALIEEEKLSKAIIDSKYPNAISIYHYPQIINLAAWCAIKKKVIGVLGMFTFGGILLADQGYIEQDTSSIITLLNGFILSHLFIGTLPLRNFIGRIYLDGITNKPILCYIDYNGNRHDEQFNEGDLYFASRQYKFKLLKKITSDKYWILLISKSTGRKFRINISWADISYQETLENTFGPIPPDAFPF